MKAIMLILVLCLFETQVFADAATIIKQRARGLSESTANQQTEKPSPPSKQPAPAAVQPTPQIRLSAEQEDAARQVLSALEQIKAGTTPTDEQKKNIRKKLIESVQGAIRPKPKLIENLADALAEAYCEVSLSQEAKNAISRNIVLILNSRNLPERSIDALANNVKTLLKAGGASEPRVNTVFQCLRDISKDLRS